MPKDADRSCNADFSYEKVNFDFVFRASLAALSQNNSYSKEDVLR